MVSRLAVNQLFTVRPCEEKQIKRFLKWNYPIEFKQLIKRRLFHYRKAITNPSALTSIYYIKGYKEGRRGEVHSAIEKEIQRLKS